MSFSSANLRQSPAFTLNPLDTQCNQSERLPPTLTLGFGFNCIHLRPPGGAHKTHISGQICPFHSGYVVCVIFLL